MIIYERDNGGQTLMSDLISRRFMEKKKIIAQKNNRLELLDVIRGVTLINMVFYHTLYDVAMFSPKKMDWYFGLPGYIWQQAICWTFIFLSGMCRAIGRKALRRGLIVSGCGLLVTLVTFLFMPEERILFGVLTFTGAAMLFVLPFEKLFKRIPPFIGMAAAALGFFLTKDIYYGYLGFEGLEIVKLPKLLYANVVTAFFGFPNPEFYSADYFSFLPWIFLFLMGYFMWLGIGEKIKEKRIMHFNIPFLSFLGRHSLIIYMLHQPIAYGLVYLIFGVLM